MILYLRLALPFIPTQLYKILPYVVTVIVLIFSSLRNNKEIQALMKWMAPKTGIERICVQSNCSEDAGRLVHYMATQKVIA